MISGVIPGQLMGDKLNKKRAGLHPAMNRMRLLNDLKSLTWGILLVILVSSGCGKKPDVRQNVSGLEKAFPSATASVPAQQVDPTPAFVQVGSDANTYVNLALTAVRTNDYAGGVIALQKVERMPGVTAQQLMAIESAKQALTADLVARADRGDAKAKAELAAIEKTRSQ